MLSFQWCKPLIRTCGTRSFSDDELNAENTGSRVRGAAMLALLGLFLSFTANAQIAQIFYVPVDETHYRDLAIAVNTADAGDTTAPNPDTVHTVISLSAFVDATTVYYDHWEDGYEVDPVNPVQASSTTTVLNAGDFQVLESDVFANPRDPSNILFDARDRITTTEQIAVTRAGWRLQEATLLAGATAVFPTFDWGTEFEVAMGEDVANHNMFEYTSVSITTGDRGAIVSVDANADGTFESNITINPGDTAIVDNVQLGARLLSTDPVQMYALTGDRDTTYASRWFLLVPRDQWDSNYFNPTGTVDGGDPATVHLYNPHGSAITVTHETLQTTTVTNTYDNTTSGTIDGATTCGAPLVRTFVVPDTFTVNSVLLGFNASHTYRGDIQATLESPAGTRVQVINSNGGDGDNNYDMLLDDSSANPLDDGGADTVAAPFYDRTAGPSNSMGAFNGESSNGTWTLEMCDVFATEDDGTFNRAQLQLLESTGSMIVQGTVSVPSGGLTEFTMPLDTAGRFFTTSGEDFFAYTTIDYDGIAHDWGFTLLPEESLTTTLAVGYAVGRDPTSAVNPTENGSPIWVTTNGATDIYVDFDGDPSTGALTDPLGNMYDQLVTAAELELIRLYDAGDGNQSGMRIYTLDGTLLSASYGQDPTTASGGQPGLDLGTTVLPIRRVRVSKEGILVNDLDGDGGIDPGDTIRYRIEVTNVSDTPIADVFTEDNGLDANVTYVPGTTEIDGVVQADDTVGATVFPLDEGGVNLGTMQPGQVIVILFRAQINDPFPVGVPAVTNGVEVRTDTEIEVDTSSSPVGDPTLAITKVSDATTDLLPGDTVNYTITVTNNSAVTQNGLSVVDSLPTGTIYDAETTMVDGFSVSNALNLYSTTSGGAVTDGTTCLSPLVRLINVPDTYIVGDIEFGFNADHNERGDIQVTLESPAGTRIQVIGTSGDGDNNYDVLLDDASANALDDGDADNTAAPLYDRTAQPSIVLNAFIGQQANGDWRVEVCDDDVNGVTGTFNSAQLQLTGLTQFTQEIKTNQAAAANPLLDGVPTDLVLSPDQFSLASAQTMTITYSVTLEDPLDINVINISNTALATSLENPFPVVATVVDPVTAGATIGDRIWLDTDGDGIQDVGEPGINNVTVNIFNTGPDGMIGGGDDFLAGTQTTDPNGNYLFERLYPGSYYVDVDATTLPAGLTTSPGTTDPSSVITVAAEEVILTVDFGYTNADPTAGIIGDYLWSDADADGVQDPGEPGIGGVTMQLVDNMGMVVTSTTTAADGSYLFAGVTPGEYTVRVEASELLAGGTLENFTATSGPQSEGADQSDPVTVTAGDVILDVDFGYVDAATTYSITDSVWLDVDADGVFDATENGINDVTVNLLDNMGVVIASTTSDATGGFSFNGVSPGDYTISISDNNGELIGLSGTTTPGQNRSLAVTVVAADVTGINFGYNAPGTIGDRIWSDANGDGVQDPGEVGISGVTVELVDRNNMVVDSQVTGPNGDYLFDGVAPELFTVRVVQDAALTGYTQTGDPDATLDNQSSFTLLLGESNLDQDFGYQNTALPELSGTVFSDLNANGVEEGGEPGFQGVSLDLLRKTNASLNQTASQSSTLGGFVAGNAVDGNTSTFSHTNSGDLTPSWEVNLGSTQEISSIEITTRSGCCTPERDYNLIVEVLDAGGNVVFTNPTLNPWDGTGTPPVVGAPAIFDVQLGTAVAGQRVRISKSPAFSATSNNEVLQLGEIEVCVFNRVGTTFTDALGNYTFSDLPAGDYRVSVTDTSTVLDGFNLTSGLDTIPVTMAGVDVTDIDFGYARDPDIARITDFVWLDSDADGIFDSNEQGISMVTVNLYEDTDGDGMFDPMNDTLIATDLTDPDGRYLFDGLPAGSYFVDVVEATVPANLVPTTFLPGFSNLIALSEGETAQEAAFGFTPSPTTTALSGTTWVDANNDGNRQPGEAPISGVDITVLSVATGLPVATTVTAADGTWLVTGLSPGDYVVVYDDADIPAGLDETQPTNLPPGDDTYTVSLAAGESIGNLDFGFFGAGATLRRIDGTVYNDEDTSFLQNGAEPGIANVTLELLDNMGNVIATTTSDLNGDYSFTGLLPAVYSVRVTDINGALDSFNPTQLLPATTDVTAADAMDVDAGYVAGSLLGSVGNLIWLDLNTDGIADNDEPGISGVTVQCWLDTNRDGAITLGLDNLIRETRTDLNGEYTCDSLPSDYYVVTVTDEDNVLSDAIKQLAPGNDSQSYSNVDNASKVDPYGLITMSPNLTADFGYAGTRDLSGTVFADADNDGMLDGGEDRVLNATLTLYRDLNGNGLVDPTDAIFGTTMSAVDGTYSFTNLPAGNYIVTSDVSSTPVAGDTQTTQTATFGVQPVDLTGGNTSSTGNDFGYFQQPVTTPVTLSSFMATVIGADLSITWTTETEVGNVGFFLYADDGEGNLRPLGNLVASHVVDSVTPQSYTAHIDNESSSTLWIEDIDVLGKRTRHGPFSVGTQHGAPADMQLLATNWDGIVSESENKEQLRRLAQGIRNSAELRVSDTGMQRVTYEQLLASGVDMAGIPMDRLQLTLGGVTQPIYVAGPDSTFGAGAYIDFYGEALESLYTRENVYRLAQSSDPRIVRILDDTTVPAEVDPGVHYRQVTSIDENKRYSFGSPNGDPWFQDELLAHGGNASVSYNVPVSELRDGNARITLDLWTVTNLPDVVDHRIVAELNSQQLMDEQFDGLQVVERQFDLSTALLVNGNNPIDVEARLEDGVLFSLVNTEAVSIDYPRNLVAIDNELDFIAINASTPNAGAAKSGDSIFSDGFEVNTNGTTIEVNGFSDSNIVVYGIGSDSAVRMSAASLGGQPGNHSVRFVTTTPGHHYVATTVAAMKTPSIEAMSTPQDLLSGSFDYLMVVHPDFITDITPLVDHHQNTGLTVRVTNLYDVYDIFSDGVVTPTAIDQYIQYAVTNQDAEFVLLVGGDTYDYQNYLGLGVKSFVPSHYVRTGPIVAYTPTDAPYADFNNDLRPDVALGRLPARSSAELLAMVTKTLEYSALNTGGLAVFASDLSGPDGNFKAESESLEQLLSGNWFITTAHLDDHPVASARQILNDAIHGGVAMTSYFGHSGPTTWSFEGLFTATDAAALTNIGLSTVVTQWGCWNTYYVSPHNDTMAHAWLTGNNGAAAVLGTATLTQTESDRELGELLIPLMTQPGKTLGQALMEAKQTLAATNPELIDVLLGFTLLGDPAMTLQTAN